MTSQEDMNDRINTLQNIVESLFAEVKILSSHYKNNNRLLAGLCKDVPMQIKALAATFKRYEDFRDAEEVKKTVEKYTTSEVINCDFTKH